MPLPLTVLLTTLALGAGLFVCLLLALAGLCCTAWVLGRLRGR